MEATIFRTDSSPSMVSEEIVMGIELFGLDIQAGSAEMMVQWQVHAFTTATVSLDS